MKTLFKGILNHYVAKKQNVLIGKNSNILHSNIFEGKNRIGSNSTVSNSLIGFGSYIGQSCLFDRIKVGRYCSIGNNVKVISSTHPVKNFVTTHPAFFSKSKQAGFSYVDKQLFHEMKLLNDNENISVDIGNDVWIGDDVTLLGGVTVGNGAIIGTKSLVTKDIPAYSIYAGVPAREIRRRFTDEQIKLLLDVKWWDKDEGWIQDNIELFADINNFLSNLRD